MIDVRPRHDGCVKDHTEPERVSPEKTKTINEFVYHAVFIEHSLRGWRDLRPSLREAIMFALLVAALGYGLVVLFWGAVHTQCAWNNGGPKCNGAP